MLNIVAASLHWEQRPEQASCAKPLAQIVALPKETEC